ncbi:AraC family transcriptional activator of pobA [Rhizobium skierniewicense]|uniref:AraC family transcriptional activator of pobA n=1 Tax=Rhizobium skierniewicense TaxID=984260 RepID=A0A7W6C225_9HYPH|nr:helix-turn-helix domain-containing protein [Rhizobium skierniewicense]MBB3944303.1 AraC family transcriptional activator of pobA [Rhizobium skierniewicense]
MTRFGEDHLYGEDPAQQVDFRFHCETLYSRSSLHRFEIGLHRHEGFLQILFVSGGEGDAVLKGQVEVITPPAVIVVPPGFQHGFRFSPDITGIIVTIIPSALPAAVQALWRRYFTNPTSMMLETHGALDDVRSCCETILREYSSGGLASNALIESQIVSLTVHLARISQQTFRDAGPDDNGARFERLLDLVARHIREQKRTAFYAEQLGISQTHLNRLVRQQSGISLQRLVAQKQIDIAKQELLFTVSTVQMVADGLGFDDPAYFSRFFLRETGMNPRAWRVAEQKRLSISPPSGDQTNILASSA